MSLSIDKDPTAFFSVVGAAYVPEQRDDCQGHLSESRSDVQQPETGVAGLWLVFYAVIIGASLLTNGGASKLSHLASLVLN
ncbi:MAG TPA: hypothetical protein VIM38_01980 [Alphaproteobacteria bacterium]